MRRDIAARCAALLCGAVPLAAPAAAQVCVAPPAPPASNAPAQSPHDGDLSTRDALTGNWGGLRSSLEDEGYAFGADTTDEILGNPTGGTRQGAIYEGRLQLQTTIDLDKTLGWTGATAHANAYEIRGRGLSANDLDNLATVSGIEAARSLKLFDLWVDQCLFDKTLSIRAGQLAADDEFFTSATASTFVNATFGWPAILATDLPNGGPAYPLATPGIRFAYAATSTISTLLGIFNGDPGSQQTGDPGGTAFRLGPSAFVILEGDYAVNQDSGAPGLAASYKLGGWFHSGAFADQQLASNGVSLAAQASTGIPALHQDDGGLYIVLDQQVLKEPDPVNRSASVFLRLSGAPSDRNEVALYADAGVNLTGFIAGRPRDVIGLAAGVAKVGARAAALDQDVRTFTGLATPVRDEEAVLELTYRAQVTHWWTVQPDLQFIRHPGGSIAVPGSVPPVRAIPDATVLGVRSAMVF